RVQSAGVGVQGPANVRLFYLRFSVVGLPMVDHAVAMRFESPVYAADIPPAGEVSDRVVCALVQPANEVRGPDQVEVPDVRIYPERRSALERDFGADVVVVHV